MSDTDSVRGAVLAHVIQHVGSVAGAIQVPTHAGPMEVLHVPPTEGKPWHVLVTSGASDVQMPVPEEDEVPARAELLLALPPDWPVDERGLTDPAFAWPIRLLTSIAALPKMQPMWLGPGHSLPNGDPPEPFGPGIQFCAALIVPPLTLFPEARELAGPDGPIALYGLVPIFERELELKLKEGTGALLQRFDDEGVSELLDVHRASVAGELLDLLKGRRR